MYSPSAVLERALMHIYCTLKALLLISVSLISLPVACRIEGLSIVLNSHACVPLRWMHLSSLCKGTSGWTVSGDYQCSSNTTMKVQASLNSCMDNFNCDNGDCVYMAQRCNGVNDCEDSSDEFNCKVGN